MITNELISFNCYQLDVGQCFDIFAHVDPDQWSLQVLEVIIGQPMGKVSQLFRRYHIVYVLVVVVLVVRYGDIVCTSRVDARGPCETHLLPERKSVLIVLKGVIEDLDATLSEQVAETAAFVGYGEANVATFGTCLHEDGTLDLGQVNECPVFFFLCTESTCFIELGLILIDLQKV